MEFVSLVAETQVSEEFHLGHVGGEQELVLLDDVLRGGRAAGVTHSGVRLLPLKFIDFGLKRVDLLFERLIIGGALGKGGEGAEGQCKGEEMGDAVHGNRVWLRCKCGC